MQFDAGSVLPYLGAVEINGVDSAGFLHAQLSTAVLKLEIGQQQMSCWCDVKGNVIAPILVERLETHGFILVLSASLIETVVKRMRLYVMRAAVTVEHSQRAVMARPAADQKVHLPWHPQFAITTGNSDCEPQQNLIDACRQHHIETRFSWLGPASSAQYLPQMLEMERWAAVDYKKGCYPGQEVIARIHYRGKVKRSLYIVQTGSDEDAGFSIGAKLFDAQEQPGGQLIEVIKQGTLSTGLAVLRDSMLSSDLFVSDNEALPLRVKVFK